MERWTRPRKAAPFQPRHWRAHPRFVPLIFRLPCGRTTEMAGKAGMIESLMSGILGDSRRPDADRPALGVPMLADWLPYRSFDAKRSEEHTSELQSLMRNSYAVFGLK